MKCKVVFAGVGAFLMLLFFAWPSYAEDNGPVEPGTYKEREVLLELRKYSSDVEQGRISVPEEQYLIKFTQPKEEEYSILQANLFTEESMNKREENLAASLGLFSEEKELQTNYAVGEEATNWLPWLLSGVAAVLVSVLLFFVVPKVNG